MTNIDIQGLELTAEQKVEVVSINGTLYYEILTPGCGVMWLPVYIDEDED
jgi:hypothetical protein